MRPMGSGGLRAGRTSMPTAHSLRCCASRDWSWEPWPEEAGEIADHERRKQERLAKRGKK